MPPISRKEPAVLWGLLRGNDGCLISSGGGVIVGVPLDSCETIQKCQGKQDQQPMQRWGMMISSRLQK